MAKLEEILPEIRKGRRFRNKNWKNNSWQETGKVYVHDFTFSDLVNKDWELEPKAVTVTREQVVKAMHGAWDTSGSYLEVIERACKELGFSDE